MANTQSFLSKHQIGMFFLKLKTHNLKHYLARHQNRTPKFKEFLIATFIAKNNSSIDKWLKVAGHPKDYTVIRKIIYGK